MQARSRVAGGSAGDKDGSGAGPAGRGHETQDAQAEREAVVILLVETHGKVRKLILNRPDKLNSFNPDLHHALRDALQAAAASSACRAVLLTGAGRGFCAGQDLGERRPEDGTPDLGSTIESFYNPLVRLLRSLPVPVVCAVNGVAAGAGANLAFACDIVLAARSARFLQAFAKLGLVPDTGGTWTLPRLVGPARARGLAMLAEPIAAEQAEAWGMIWKAVDDTALQDEAMAVAQRLGAGPTEGLVRMRRALDAAETNTLDAQLDLERDLQREAGRHADYAEGVRAFLEKRPVCFTERT